MDDPYPRYDPTTIRKSSAGRLPQEMVGQRMRNDTGHLSKAAARRLIPTHFLGDANESSRGERGSQRRSRPKCLLVSRVRQAETRPDGPTFQPTCTSTVEASL